MLLSSVIHVTLSALPGAVMFGLPEAIIKKPEERVPQKVASVFRSAAEGYLANLGGAVAVTQWREGNARALIEGAISGSESSESMGLALAAGANVIGMIGMLIVAGLAVKLCDDKGRRWIESGHITPFNLFRMPCGLLIPLTAMCPPIGLVLVMWWVGIVGVLGFGNYCASSLLNHLI